jgi:hypothetical protein
MKAEEKPKTEPLEDEWDDARFLRPSDVDGSDPDSPLVTLSPEEVDELRVPITREEGYRRSRGKEQLGLAATRSFFSQHGIEVTHITDADENFRHGDFRLPRGTTVEVKSQPIDPARYSQNFVEVMENTTALERPHHADGFERTAALLEMSPEELARIRVRGPRDGWGGPMGRLKYVSASLTSIAGSVATVYVNPEGGHLYLYSSGRLLRHVRCSARRGLYLGMGMSNQDSFAVFVPVPDARWTRRNSVWLFSGTGDEAPILAAFRKLTS